SFLIEMSGMKVKPWATTEESLAALHTTLVARSGCDIFWGSLRVLLETLARDLKTRQQASPGALVDNELLDGERYATLLDEIRAALAGQATEPGTFRRLASALSAPALGLLLLLGGVASVGCDRTGLHGSTQAQDAGLAGVADAKVAQPEANPDLPPTIFVPPVLTTPDARSVADVEMAPRQSDGGTVTILDIMQACNIPDDQQQRIMGCLSTMRASWTTGIVELLAGTDCYTVAGALRCDPWDDCSEALLGVGAEFDPTMPAICRPMPIYLGVRFV
ncbi:MAG TPA: hypothetical protein VJ801_00065, partial [Polyangia bacterium]|nr:hypothetical protein [Polyangia bacterium]